MTNNIKEITKVAEQGDADAQVGLGVRYANGKGVEQNYEASVKWFTLAAEQGHADAQYSLGVMYTYSMGVEANYEEAVKWYTLAAEQGDADAEYNLGCMYDPLNYIYGETLNRIMTKLLNGTL